MRLRPTICRLSFAWAFVSILVAAQTPGSTKSAASQTASVGSAARIIPPAPDRRWPLNQTYHYGAEWRIFNAGTATLRLDTAGREHRVVSTADSSGVVGLLYRVHDRVESFFDPQTFCSRSVSKRTEEGRRKLETEITFDAARRKSVLNEKNLKENTNKTEENDIPECVTDVVSSIYYLAALPLADKTTYHFPMNDGGKTAEVKAVVSSREEIKVPAGAFKAVRVVITSDTGKLKEKGQIEIWFSDDVARTPVQMKARMFWGTLVFRLLRIETSQAK